MMIIWIWSYDFAFIHITASSRGDSGRSLATEQTRRYLQGDTTIILHTSVPCTVLH